MPRRRWLGAGVALGGKLYVIGGYTENPDGSIKAVRTTSVYDAATDTWATKAPMPTARAHFAASRVVLNGQPRIEVVGGLRPGNNLAYIP
jgi:N-acetylneuraminic acid mutarotase